MRKDTWNHNGWDPWEQDTYQTGKTRPPKSHDGLIAVLLVLVILLCGIVSVLSLLNIRLFRQLSIQSKENQNMLSFHTAETTASTEDTTRICAPGQPFLGIEGESISSFYQMYYHLPAGLYITEVTEGSNAEKVGLRSGDVLISIDNTHIPDNDTLASILNAHQVGDTVQAVIYRGGRQYRVALTIDEAR